jgi:FlgD Ig-like domain
MTPRTTWSPHPASRTRALLVTGFVALLAFAATAPPVSATLTSITTEPGSPTTCDLVTLVVAGTTPTPCFRIVRAELKGPVELPTMGPIPTYEIQVRLVLQPTDDPVCPTVIQPYDRSFDLGRLRFGSYWVKAIEYVMEAGSNVSLMSDSLSGSFDVAIADGCPPPEPCVMLGFGRADPNGCHGSALPGGRLSLPIALTNSVPVGGVQTLVAPFQRDPLAGSVPADSHVVIWPVAVETTDRTSGFQIAWTVEGSRIRVLLYSTSGGVIEPGQGPIFRVIYEVAPHAESLTYLVRLEDSIVADPLGHGLPSCPTVRFAEEVGRLCIIGPGCDLNGDGSSDILDVVQLVNCALAAPESTEACPDSVASKADCNGDGSLDVRDVICCVRKILDAGGFGTRDPGGLPGEPTRIGFTGPARWITPLTGRAEIIVTPGADFGGIDFGIVAASSGARISGMRLAPGSGYQLESSVASDGTSARGMLLSMGAGSGTATVLVDLHPSLPAGGGGALSLAGVQSATRLALEMTTTVGTESAPVPHVDAPGAPSVEAARPNPFREETEITYALPAASRTTLRVYSASGRLVRTLVDSELPAGVHRARWDGKDTVGRSAGSGIYFLRFSAGGVARTSRIMLLR